MNTVKSTLSHKLLSADGQSYGQYQSLYGEAYSVGAHRLYFDYVQKDPFAAPSRACLEIEANRANLPDWSLAKPEGIRATADYLHRALIRELAFGQIQIGSGKSGRLEMASLGQQVLERTSVVLDAIDGVTIRFRVGLPAQGRRILGEAAVELLTERLPSAIDRVFLGLEPNVLQRHVWSVEDQVCLRSQLAKSGLVAFLGEGSVLPRRTGADDRPMEDALPLLIDDRLACTLETPHSGSVRGLGIGEGVTLIVGGGYHGKSTLLSSIAQGVYDHIPGDGRDWTVSVDTAVSVRAEEGRGISGVDVRPFIDNLPGGRDASCLHTSDSSGSTSQAAGIVEALEAGATTLLFDEDTSAFNFMIRDSRMRRLVPDNDEPITPYVDRVRRLFQRRRISSILVVGGAGDYLDVADTVIQMQEFQPKDVTVLGKEIAREIPRRLENIVEVDRLPLERVVQCTSLDPSRDRKLENVRGVGTQRLQFGKEDIDISSLHQLVDACQCRMIGDVMLKISQGFAGERVSIRSLLEAIDKAILTGGLASVVRRGCGDRARARRFEIAAVLNRLRNLQLS